MGVKYSATESAALIQALGNNIKLANEITDRLSKGCDNLSEALNSGELQGAAYTAGKGLFSNVIIPSIKQLQLAIDDVQGELEAYQNADAEVSSYGTLDLDMLKRWKSNTERQIEQINYQIQEINSYWNKLSAFVTFNMTSYVERSQALYNEKHELEKTVLKLADKIDRLEWFVAQISSYFSDSLNVLQLAIQGAGQLSKILMDIDGSYDVTGLDMTWITSLIQAPIYTYKADKYIDLNAMAFGGENYASEFKKNVVKQYGLTEESAEILWKFYQNIYEQEGNENNRTDRLFNRFLGGVIYTKTPSEEFSFKSIASSYMWEETAGPVLHLSGKTIPTITGWMKEHGLSDSEVRVLVDDIKDNHDQENYRNDFAHQAMTTATHLYTGFQLAQAVYIWNQLPSIVQLERSTSDVGAKEYVNQLSGWRGDATKQALVEPSMGTSDYKADLDAVNITRWMEKEKVDYITALNHYYAGLESGKYTRASLFLNNVGGIEYVRNELFKAWGVSNLDELKAANSVAYNFIQSLEGLDGVDTNEYTEFIQEKKK